MSHTLYHHDFDPYDIWSYGVTVTQTKEGIAIRWIDHTDNTPRTDYYWSGNHPDLTLLKNPEGAYNNYVTNRMVFFEELKGYLPWRTMRK